jgi:hypothetical protein
VDLPDPNVKCHRTGFKKSCHKMVTECQCRLWVKVQGQHPQVDGKTVDYYDCADAWTPLLLLEVAAKVRENTASTDKVANEVKKGADDNVTMGAIAVQRAQGAIREAVQEVLEQVQTPQLPFREPLLLNGDVKRIGKD